VSDVSSAFSTPTNAAVEANQDPALSSAFSTPTEAAVKANTPPPPDEVTITVGTQKIGGWQGIRVTRSIEEVPSQFSLTMTEAYPDAATKIAVTPGQACTISIGSDVVLTGYLDRYSIKIGPHSHSVEMVGRGMCEDLTDCSADLITPGGPVEGGQCTATGMLDLAQKLCKAFGITAVLIPQDTTGPIHTFQVGLGATPMDVLHQVANYLGYLLYENPEGQLVIDRVGTNKMATGFRQGDNIEEFEVTFGADQRFTDYYMTYSAFDQTSEGDDANIWNRRAEIHDPTLRALGRKRPHITVSLQTDNTADFAQRAVGWDMARRIGRSQAVSIRCDKWRDQKGQLWTPNWLATFDMPAAKLHNQSWVIGTVSYIKDYSGTHAEVMLMPPGAFSVEPGPLNIYDWEIGGSVSNPNAGPPSPDDFSTPTTAALAANAPPPTAPPITAPASQVGPGGLQGHV
jgi:prophage tail gpP-like protein